MTPKSWLCEVRTEGRHWSTNSLRFATKEEAENYGVDLLSRWLVPDKHRAVESEEPVNYTFHDWQLKPLPKE